MEVAGTKTLNEQDIFTRAREIRAESDSRRRDMRGNEKRERPKTSAWKTVAVTSSDDEYVAVCTLCDSKIVVGQANRNRGST